MNTFENNMSDSQGQHDTNQAVENAWEFVEHTGKSIFLTGKAGTGKTTFLKNVVERSKKNLVVVAPTGVAAMNAGGVTIHSFFQLPLSPFVPGQKAKTFFEFGREKRRIIAALDLLVIDEISMVRADLLDAMDSVLRRFRDKNRPFGGVQLLMIGDLCQLTPVVTPEDEGLIREYYNTPYFFGSKALAAVDYVTIVLDKVYRQEDDNFVGILNNIREGHATERDLEILNSRYNAQYEPPEGCGYIRLTTHNRNADAYNDKKLADIDRKPYVYNAEITGSFPEYSYPTAPSLTLKVGAQVMFVKNDSSDEHLYYNGKIGEVTYLDQTKIRVECIGDKDEIEVTQEEWENNKYTINPETLEIQTEIQGIFKQFPLRLAWAITIHKSQGLTFDRAVIDASNSFAPGQVYVALSRCRSLEGMTLSSRLLPYNIITDNYVSSYITNQEKCAAESVKNLPRLKDDYYRQLMMELFDFRNLFDAEESMLRLMETSFSSSYPSLLEGHRQAYRDMNDKIRAVADKWRAVIMASNISLLQENAFLERVKRSAAYFANEIKASLENVIHLSGNIKTQNKELGRRLPFVVNALRVAYCIHLGLLEEISEAGFSVSEYLDAKYMAIMKAENTDKKTKARKSGSSEKKAKAEKTKEKTWQTTYNMFRSGMSPLDIAKERMLTPQTIFGHLERFINSGDLKMEEVIEQKRIQTIRDAITMAGSAAGVTDIKNLCPDYIMYHEIRMVLKNTPM